MHGFLSPYRGERYHLQEYRGRRHQPTNAKDLFNYRHSSLRNVIERCFEVLKKRFLILKMMPSYSLKKQTRIVIAACAIHNFIRMEAQQDILFDEYDNEELVIEEEQIGGSTQNIIEMDRSSTSRHEMGKFSALSNRTNTSSAISLHRAVTMSQVDNRNSSAAKRARTDGSRREDDWTCPSCGNVNFSFRTTCNMRNCTQPRPADHNSKSAAKPVQAPQGYSSSAPYAGSGAPSSMYLSVPPYGSSLFNGTSIPPYDVPFSGGSAYHYNYGSRLSTGSPYRPMHLSGPAPYSSGSMMGNGGMYGMPPPLMDRYGLGLQMGHAAMGPRPGFYPEDKSQKKGADATRDNDWTCPKCGNVNFSFRTVCNMRKCNTPKPGSQAAKSEKSSRQKMPDGSWKCEKCNNINYPLQEQV
ncbi:hypothetical protein L1049_007198 [Liquidambar formosana]|uniref:RanBP2-type domain-containing protein n=1 Tax=Liquidambar formosana TaxID=63359 RepID=A0AAP0RI70_LIQFO